MARAGRAAYRKAVVAAARRLKSDVVDRPTGHASQVAWEFQANSCAKPLDAAPPNAGLSARSGLGSDTFGRKKQKIGKQSPPSASTAAYTVGKYLPMGSASWSGIWSTGKRGAERLRRCKASFGAVGRLRFIPLKRCKLHTDRAKTHPEWIPSRR